MMAWARWPLWWHEGGSVEALSVSDRPGHRRSNYCRNYGLDLHKAPSLPDLLESIKEPIHSHYIQNMHDAQKLIFNSWTFFLYMQSESNELEHQQDIPKQALQSFYLETHNHSYFLWCHFIFLGVKRSPLMMRDGTSTISISLLITEHSIKNYDPNESLYYTARTFKCPIKQIKDIKMTDGRIHK